MIPVNEPVISLEAKNNVNEALKTGWLSSAGPFVKEFEDKFAKFIGVKHAITVNTGTAALHIALLTAGIKAGDEVIVPAFTMAATWLAILYVGAVPIFVDAEKETYNIDPDQIEARITSRTKAIMPVHIYGHPVEMDKIKIIANKHKLIIIEDAAEAHGAVYKGTKTGNLGDIGCFSFYANKLITTGEGGMVVTNNDQYAEEARKYKDLYHSPAKRFIHQKIGYNYRMTNLQAAVGVGELGHINEYVKKKIDMANLYNNLLQDVPGLTLPATKQECINVYWMYALRVDEKKFGANKDLLRVKLLEKGVETRDFFYAPDDQPVLREYLKNDHYPTAKLLSKTGLYLPSGLALTDAQIRLVSQAFHEIYNQK